LFSPELLLVPNFSSLLCLCGLITSLFTCAHVSPLLAACSAMPDHGGTGRRRHRLFWRFLLQNHSVVVASLMSQMSCPLSLHFVGNVPVVMFVFLRISWRVPLMPYRHLILLWCCLFLCRIIRLLCIRCTPVLRCWIGLRLLLRRALPVVRLMQVPVVHHRHGF
jgi:hypothetical protein